MSISGTLFNAYSGLVAASRTAETISDNVANALTEGFGRRQVELTAASLNGRGSGVRVTGIRRNVDQVAIADRRLAQADLANSDAKSTMLAKMERTLGIPGEGGSISDLTTAFEVALTSAQSRPDSQVRLQNILSSAANLSNKINNISDAVQTQRMAADNSIGKLVDTLNGKLDNIDQLNKTIRLQVGSGKSANGLMDQRQVLVDQISDIVPVKTYQRENGQISIVSSGGVILLDGSHPRFEFRSSGQITPDMTIQSGALSGLSLNGRLVTIGNGNGGLDGGSLSAMFEIRDKIAVAAGQQIDAVARNLGERFQASGLDTTLATGAAGLFTDAGASVGATYETGLAGRLTVNTAVDPAEGGALWRLRDGLGATAPGNSGNAVLLTGFIGALTNSAPTQSGNFSPQVKGFSSLIGDFTAQNGSQRLAADEAKSFAQGRYKGLKTVEAGSGVDTNREMQNLLLVQNAYSANARVVSVVGQMLKTVMEL